MEVGNITTVPMQNSATLVNPLEESASPQETWGTNMNSILSQCYRHRTNCKDNIIYVSYFEDGETEAPKA